MISQNCDTCKHDLRNERQEPCVSCNVRNPWNHKNTSNWTPKRKLLLEENAELQAALAAANKRIKELVSQCNEIYKREEEVTLSLTQAEYGFTVDQMVTNSTIDSLQSQLAAANKRIAELEDAWLQDEGIAPDGTLRPTMAKLRERVAELERELEGVKVAKHRLQNQFNSLFTNGIIEYLQKHGSKFLGGI